jgi:Tfp pilus assembly protein PilP
VTSRANEPHETKTLASVEVPPEAPASSTFKPIGYVEKAGGQVEAIISQDSQVYVVHLGERFADKYRVLKITPDSVEAIEDMPVPAAPLNTRDNEFKVLRADLRMSSLSPGGPAVPKSPDVVRAPAVPEHETAARRKSDTLPGELKAKAAAPMAAPPLGYIEKANGHVEAVVAEGGTVRLVAQVPEAATAHEASPVSVLARSSVEKVSVPHPLLPKEPALETEDRSTPPVETLAYVSAMPAQAVANEQPDTVSGPAVRSLLDPSEQVLAAPSAHLSMNGAQPDTKPVPISEARPPDAGSTPSDSQPTTALKPLGFIEKADGELDAVVSRDDEVFVVRQGETFGERFRAVRVSREAVDVAEVSPHQGRASPTIPLIYAMPDLMSFDIRAGPSPPDLGELGFGSEGENSGNADVPTADLSSAVSPLGTSAKNQRSHLAQGATKYHVQKESAEAAQFSQEAATLVFQTLGSVETSNGEIEAVVADGSEVYLVKQGECFADQYLAVSVDPSLVLAVRATPENDMENLLSRRADSGKKPASKKLNGVRSFQRASVANLLVPQNMGAPAGPDLTDLGVNLFHSSGFTGYDLQSHLVIADNPNGSF